MGMQQMQQARGAGRLLIHHGVPVPPALPALSICRCLSDHQNEIEHPPDQPGAEQKKKV